jgi:hypothetical protein
MHITFAFDRLLLYDVRIVCSHPFSLSHYYDEDFLVVDEEEAGIDMTRVRGRLVILLLDTRQTTSRCHLSLSLSLSLSSLVDNNTHFN